MESLTNNKDQLLFISSYPPRECGIATFTQDLINGINTIFNRSFDIQVCALEEDETVKRTYPKEVSITLNSQCIEEYIALAETVNRNDLLSAVVIEHEFGLFGGTYGDHLFHFLDNTTKPVFVCFHTVLENPDEKLLKVVTRIAATIEKIVVLTAHSKNILERCYHIPSSQVIIIPHGIHMVKPVIDRPALKAKYGFGDKFILGTFGLISSNKGIETALEAIAALPDKKNVLYLVIGKTHPCVYKQEGEKYREYLIQKTADLGIEENVLFINKYLELPELLTYLKLIDIYVFTSNNPLQTASGTLSYAMGSGCTVVSTPIPHAKEILDKGAGYIFDFGNSMQLSKIITDLTTFPEKLKETSLNAIRKASSNTWENIGNRFIKMITKYAGSRHKLTYNSPPLKLDHFCRLTTHQGMIQFSRMCEPDHLSGYTTDDNARALYVLVNYNELYHNDPLIEKYIQVYLNFLNRMLRPDGRFLNYMDDEGNFTEQNFCENLEEANARAFVALARLISSKHIKPHLKLQANRLVGHSANYMYSLRSPRSMAKVIKGLYYLDQTKKDPDNQMHIHLLSQELIRLYQSCSVPGWNWYEPYITYNNSALPEGLIYAYLATNKTAYKAVAESSFDFLLSLMFTQNRIRAISNNGWVHKGRLYTHQYGEQPVEIASIIEALHIFYCATGETQYKNYMQTAFSWFLGNNHLSQLIYNPATGGCHDGIEEFEVNINEGAESTLSYLISKLTLERFDIDDKFMTELIAFGKDESSIHE